MIIELVTISELVHTVINFTLLGFLLGMTSFMLGLGISSGVSVLSLITKQV